MGCHPVAVVQYSTVQYSTVQYSTVHIYTQTIHRTTQNKQYIEQHNNFEKTQKIWEQSKSF